MADSLTPRSSQATDPLGISRLNQAYIGPPEYLFPPVAPGGPVPRWSGEVFVCGDRRERVLSYGSEESGWSDELTQSREDATDPDHPIDLASRSHAVRQLRRTLAESPHALLDIGCLSGRMLRELTAAFPGTRVMGADYLRAPLEELAGRMLGIPLLQFDLLHCPLPDASLDAVSLLNVLEHIDDDLVALRQVYRILRPGGIAVIEVPAGPALYDSYDRYWKHHRRYSMKGLSALAEHAGFSLVYRSHIGFLPFPAFWVVKKWSRSRDRRTPHAVASDVAWKNRHTSHSIWLAAIMGCERAFDSWTSFPFGIRCVITCQRPLELS